MVSIDDQQKSFCYWTPKIQDGGRLPY